MERKKMKTVSVAHMVGGGILLFLLSSRVYSKEFAAKHAGVFVALGVLVGAFHAYTFSKNTRRWIYLFHALFVAPSIILFGLYPGVGRQLMQLVACAMIGYHAAILAQIL
jgi:hypothetical protein